MHVKSVIISCHSISLSVANAGSRLVVDVGGIDCSRIEAENWKLNTKAML